MVKKIIDFLEYVFGISLIILYTGGILNLVGIGGASEGDANYVQATQDVDGFVVPKILYLLSYFLALVFLVRFYQRLDRLPALLLKNPFTFLLAGLAVVSAAWSELPDMTISRSIALFGTTIVGVYLASRYTFRELMILFAQAFLVIIFLSLVFIVAIPDYGMMGGIHAGSWRGIYSHKNLFGRLMCLAAVIFILQPRNRPRDGMLGLPSSAMVRYDRTLISEIKGNNILLTWLGLALSVCMLALSRSSGAIVNFGLMLVAIFAFKTIQLESNRKFFAILGGLAFLGILGAIVAPDPEILFASIGKSSDLTGRGDLWNLLIDTIWRNPLIGYGYGVFWLKYRAALGSENGGWSAPDAHNGFLDLALGVGLLGLGLFAISYALSFSTAWARFTRSRDDEDLCLPVLLVYILVSNLSESGLFAYNDIFWLLFTVVSYAAIARGRKPVLALPPVTTLQPQYALPPARDNSRYLNPVQDGTDNPVEIEEDDLPDTEILTQIHTSDTRSQ
jgi:exopolysaccharide production protein ExoQ